MRSLVRSAGAAAVLALALFGSPAAALKLGDACSNEQALSCDDGLRCYNNKCDVVRDLPAGFWNQCSADDCCPSQKEDGSDSGLICNRDAGRCFYSLALQTELKCGGGENTPDTGITLPDDFKIPFVGGYEGGTIVIGGITIPIGDDNNNDSSTGGGDVVIDNPIDDNPGSTGDGDIVIDVPTPDSTGVVETSSGTIVINPDGSVDEDGSPAPRTATAAIGLVAGLAAAAMVL